jgi:thiosulfate dehydrogenase [quinone] large subunit
MAKISRFRLAPSNPGYLNKAISGFGVFNTSMTSIANSFRKQAWPLRILRLWLGVTFLYAGWNKASDRSFFDVSSPRYIGRQLLGFSHGSPIGSLLRIASRHGLIVGWLTILTEMAIGIAILLNVASLPAAIGGAFLSLTLWLSASWNVHPYFLASDPAYFIMWAAYALALLPKRTALNGSKRTQLVNLDRREVVRIGAVGALTLFSALLGRLFQSSPTRKTQAKNNVGGKTKGGNSLIALSALPIGAAHHFTAVNGDPAILIRTGNTRVAAFDAICTHQGCTVDYDPATKTLICPCHLSQFDPLSHAAVMAGPAPAPLSEISVKIDGTNIILA